MSEHKIPIPSMLYNAAVGGHVTNSQQIIDENLNREQNDINQETVGTIPYNSTTPNGMGRIVLKKNDNFKQVVEEQTDGNTIFVIKYDFTLTDNVTVPSNCVLEFDGGSISGAYVINLNYCVCTKNISFKGVKLNNFNGKITATQLGLSQGDNIADIIGTGWKNCYVDLENIALVQRVGNIEFLGDWCHIIHWNINRINSKSTESVSSDKAEAILKFSHIPNLIIEYCTFDGTGSNENFVGGNFYFTYNGLGIFTCPDAVVRHNVIKDFPATCGIFAEYSHNIHIEDNYIKNCSIYVTPVNDTNGDGIYLRNTNNSIIKNNIVEIEDTIQIGRCGICHEYRTSGIIENNTVSGYDRGIHIECCYDYNTVRNNHVTRCHSAILLWSNSDYTNTGDVSHIIVENNYFSNKGMVKSSINNKNYTPLTYMRSIVELKNSNVDASGENKRTEFINNVIESFDTGDYNNYSYIHTDYSGKFFNNTFIKNGSHSPIFSIEHYNDTIPNHLYFCNNLFEGTFKPSIEYAKIHNNIIKQYTVQFFGVKGFDATHDYTAQISIQNNTYKMLATEPYASGAIAIFSPFGGIFKNNIWGLGTSHYSVFNEKNIAIGSIIDNNVFQITHSYEHQANKKIWYEQSANDVSPNLTPGKNLLVDLIDGSITAVVDNPQHSI